ncbi:MAG: hypothetical protein HC927_09940 [Deltaproteobacteria bacterium]|nr:hypothetical protein [Deltaproteobacteria bacterium]
MKLSKMKIFTLAIGFVTAVGASVALSKPVGASKDGSAGGCPGSCGPAPCCEILWIEFCGCPWGEEPEEFY